MSNDLSKLLLSWYDKNGRHLPWRVRGGAHPDPYVILVSELMLQQTTVQAVKAYYEAFTARWPDVGALAAAPRDEVMKAVEQKLSESNTSRIIGSFDTANNRVGVILDGH